MVGKCVSKELHEERTKLIDERDANIIRDLIGLKMEVRDYVVSIRTDMRANAESARVDLRSAIDALRTETKDAASATARGIEKSYGWINSNKNLAIAIAVAIITIVLAALKASGKL